MEKKQTIAQNDRKQNKSSEGFTIQASLVLFIGSLSEMHWTKGQYSVCAATFLRLLHLQILYELRKSTALYLYFIAETKIK